MTGWAVAALVFTGLAILALSVILWRQGFPETGPSDADADAEKGPTGEVYPPGSNPAGPGAEDMTAEPSPNVTEDT